MAIDTAANGAFEGRRAKIIEKTGAADVEKLTFDLSKIDEEGVFVNVDSAGFSMLDCALSWRSLGIDSLPKDMTVKVRPPKIDLLPERHRLALKRPVSNGYALLRKYGVSFTLAQSLFESPSFRWIPWTAFETFEALFTEEQERLAAAKSVVLEHYPAIRDELRDSYMLLARDAARRFNQLGAALDSEFVAQVVSSLDAMVPTALDIEEKLVLRRRIGAVMLGSELYAEQRAATAEKNLLRSENIHAYEQERIAEERMRSATRLLRIEEEAKAADTRREAEVKERIRQLKLEAAKEQLSETLNPLEEGAKQLQAAVHDSAAAMAKSLKQNGFIHPATAKKARDLAEWFRLMNWQNDEGLESLIDRLVTLAQPGPRAATQAEDFGTVLTEITETTHAAARSIHQEKGRLSAIEI